jgi:hypothetical protein
MPLRNTELIPARSPILGELAGLGMRNALMAINSRIVAHSEVVVRTGCSQGGFERILGQSEAGAYFGKALVAAFLLDFAAR